MAKFLADAVLDAALEFIADNGDRLDVCSQQPTTYAEATSTYTLGNTTLTVGAGNGDYTLGDGDTSGRKLTVAQQTGFNFSGTGTATHVAITNGTDTLYAVTTITSQAVASGNPATVNAFDIEIGDPT